MWPAGLFLGTDRLPSIRLYKPQFARRRFPTGMLGFIVAKIAVPSFVPTLHQKP